MDGVHPGGNLLAFDTSTELMSVALQRAPGLIGWTGEGGALASLTLIPRIEGLLVAFGTRYADLDAIAFGRGPGAFTGLRTACAVAQGLAFGAGLPVLALDSLLIVAEDARAQQPQAQDGVWVAMDARMGEVYAAAYHRLGGRWQATAEPALYTLDALNDRWAQQPPAMVAGSALAAFGERLRCGAALQVPVAADRAAALMRVAQELWQAGAGVPAASALPLYLRDKVALTTTERALVKAAKLAGVA